MRGSNLLACIGFMKIPNRRCTLKPARDHQRREPAARAGDSRRARV